MSRRQAAIQLLGPMLVVVAVGIVSSFVSAANDIYFLNALIAVAIVLGFVLTGDSSSDADVPQTGSLTNALSGAAEVEEELEGIPQAGNVLGSPRPVEPECRPVDLLDDAGASPTAPQAPPPPPQATMIAG